MNRKEALVTGIIVLLSFSSGVYTAPAVMNVFVTNFPLDNQGRLKVTPSNVTVSFPPQTSSTVLIPLNTTARSAVSLFPNLAFSRVVGNDVVTGVYLSVNMSQWKEYRAYISTSPLSPGEPFRVTKIISWTSGAGNPDIRVYACFRVQGSAPPPQCAFGANIYAALNSYTFTNATGTFLAIQSMQSQVNNAGPVDQTQGTLLDVYLEYDSPANSSQLFDIVTIGMALFLRR